MVASEGGPCVGLKKRPRNHQGDQEPAQLCAAVSSHKWYGGPTCKNCYERNKRERNNQPKIAKTEERWRNHLRPQLFKGEWTPEEDQEIWDRVQEMGTKWAQVSEQYMPSRTDNDIKNRWNSVIPRVALASRPRPQTV